MAVQQAATTTATPRTAGPECRLVIEWDTSRDGCTVCRPHGELDAFTVSLFRQAISDAASSTHVIFDLSAVPFLDSAGLGALVGGIRRIREVGGDVAICTSRGVHSRLLCTAGFDHIVHITSDVEHAAAGLHARL